MKDAELFVQYFPDSDTLRLGAGVPPFEGETIAKWLMVEWSKDEEVTGVVLKNAAKVLRPYLFPEQETDHETADGETSCQESKRTSLPSSSDNSTKESAD